MSKNETELDVYLKLLVAGIFRQSVKDIQDRRQYPFVEKNKEDATKFFDKEWAEALGTWIEIDPSYVKRRAIQEMRGGRQWVREM